MTNYKFMTNKTKIIIAVLIVVLAAASRLVKHPFNFTPVFAMSLFAGYYLGKRWAVILPLASMFISDYFIGFYDWKLMSTVYLGVAIAFSLGRIFKKYKKWPNIIWASLVSSLTFFIVTNFAVWALYDWYPHTWAGLANCFALALPFFRNSLAGDLVYTGLFFGLYELVLANDFIYNKFKQLIYSGHSDNNS